MGEKLAHPKDCHMYCLCEGEGATEVHCEKSHVFSSEDLICVPDDKAKCLRKYPINDGSSISQRGRQPPRKGRQPSFWLIFAENCMKMKFWRRGDTRSLRHPLPQKSATANTCFVQV